MVLFLLRRREVKVPSGWMSPALGHFREVPVGMQSAWEQHFVTCSGIMRGCSLSVSPVELLLEIAVFETHPLFSENQ